LSAPGPDDRKLRELNRLLAIATGLALAALIVSASLFGPPPGRWIPPGLAAGVVVLYLLIKRALKMKPTPPLIQPGSPVSLFAGILPLVILACAGAAALWPGHDFNLAVIVGGVWFAMTLEGVMPRKPS
jgi:hypothetical protein